MPRFKNVMINRFRFSVLFGVVFISLVSSVVLYFEITSRSGELVESTEENLLWAVSQLEKESYKVQVQSQLLVEKTDSHELLAGLRDKFDILFSRIDLFKHGTFAEIFGRLPSSETHLKKLDQLIARMDASIFQPLGPVAVDQILTDAIDTHQITSILLSDVLGHMTAVKVERRAQLINLYKYFGFLILLVVVGSALMTLLLYRQVVDIRNARQRAVILARKLRHKNCEARRANQAKSDFLSRMSHELRTPLNIIIGFSQLLQSEEQAFDATQRENIKEILGAGHHLLYLVNEMLELTQIEAGVIEVNLESVSVVSALESAVSKIAPLAQERGIAISLESLPDALVVKADPHRLLQVLINLLSNAIKYNREGGSIHLFAEPFGESRLRIHVQDTGHGIDPEKIDRLFSPFERLESPYNGIEGTGIGLALTKRLVEAMEGEIGVSSKPSLGSDFWFELTVWRSPGVIDARLPESA